MAHPSLAVHRSGHCCGCSHPATVSVDYSPTFPSKLCVLVCVLQNTADFSLVRSQTGEIVTEDGRSRCPFNPEYKSTAIMAGRVTVGSATVRDKFLTRHTNSRVQNHANYLTLWHERFCFFYASQKYREEHLSCR